MAKVNPLHADGLTAETVESGAQIVVYVPHATLSARRYQVLNVPYIDDDGDMVIELRSEDGHDVTLLTSEAGLSGGRYDGIWTHVAIVDEE